jgi:hypothetical protein
MRNAYLPPSAARRTIVKTSLELVELARRRSAAVKEQIVQSWRLIEDSRRLLEKSRQR